MLELGIDLGTSSIKVSVVDSATRKPIASAQYPDSEVGIISLRNGWAEQSPDQWWEHVRQAIRKCNAAGLYDPKDIAAIGIAYQMHGLVLVDKQQKVIRDSIIWCDSRAVDIGNTAFESIGGERCLSRLLNSPGNFTASKLAWVKENEPGQYERIDKVLLPGDFIALRLTGEATTTPSALSEGVLWDFVAHDLSADVTRYFGFDASLFPEVRPVFSDHGRLRSGIADDLSLTAGIPVTYKAGDQLNNALSLHVLEPGEVAATAGTSGVIYGVSDKLEYDQQSRINSFAHVNHEEEDHRIGILLCINGAGIFNRWVRDTFGGNASYQSLNEAATAIRPGAEGLLAIPFGNGAERMLNNRIVGASLHGLDLNIHTAAHLVRAAQEGIAFAFRYGLDIMKDNGLEPSVIRAGRANMFLSDVFAQAFVNATGVPVELCQSDGSIGAAIGAGIGAGHFSAADLSGSRQVIRIIEPDKARTYDHLYEGWKSLLERQLAGDAQTSDQKHISLTN